MGLAGPDQGEGGKYLFLPPGYDGEVPDGYFVAQSPTYSNWIVIRALGGVREPGDHAHLSAARPADSPPETEFINFAARRFNGIHANDFSFFEEVNTIVQEEPPEALDPERAGQLAADRDRPRPAVRTRRADARASSNGRTGRGGDRPHAAVQAARPRAYYYPDGSWKTAFVGGSYEFLARRRPAARRARDDALRRHRHHPRDDPRRRRHRLAVRLHRRGRHRRLARRRATTTRSPCPPASRPRRSGRSTSTTPRPARCCRPTTPTRASTALRRSLATEANGDIVIHFGPTKPDGDDVNWLQTVPEKGWFPILRLYGPLEPWFDKTWRPGEIQPIDD